MKIQQKINYFVEKRNVNYCTIFIKKNKENGVYFQRKNFEKNLTCVELIKSRIVIISKFSLTKF